jgi:methionyl-tRNA formyltransferase
MGTPEFAVPSLDLLRQNDFQIAGVITAPDRPAGRGLKMHESAVKQYAVAHGLPVLQPVRLKDPAFLDRLGDLKADLQVVVAFRMLPEIVWDMPPLGTINLHGSLLPQYRGAAPINWAIINGETQTGVTTFRLQHEIDTGQIIGQQRVPIGPDETAGELHDRLMDEGALLVLETVRSMASGVYKLTAQATLSGPSGVLHTAPKIFKADCRIDWTQNSRRIHDLVRGLSPYPAAWTLLNGKTLKIYRSTYLPADNPLAAGVVETDHTDYLRIACRDGWILLQEVQLEGKKRLPIEAFLRGYRQEKMVIT